MKSYKCYVCKEQDYESNMVTDYIGKQKKRFHSKCYEKYLEEQRFKQQEKKEMDNLVEVIKEVHGINTIPNQFYSYLQDLRNGNELFGNIGKKKSKEGYRYYVISETYKSCQDNINWALNNKDFNTSFNLLKYTLTIIKNNVDKVGQGIESKKKWDKYQSQKIDPSPIEDIEFNYNNKQNDDNDISDFL